MTILLVGSLVCIALFGVSLYFTYEKYKDTLDLMSISDSDFGSQNETSIEKSVQEKKNKNRKGNKSSEKEKIGKQEDEHESEEDKTEKKLEPMALLLYGMDKREQTYDRGRPDTLMLALIHPEKQKIKLISLPRDAYVSIPGYRKHKLNTSYSKGGVRLTMETIEEWLDVDLAGYASIDFQGFEKLVDLMDGIEIYVERNMHYDSSEQATHIHLDKGFQSLNGKQALDYVRFRHSNDGNTDSDYSRMKRQQMVLKLLGEKMNSFRSVTKIYEVFGVIGEHVKTSLTPEELDQLIRSMYRFDIEQLDTTTLKGEGVYKNGMWIEVVSEEERKRIKDMIDDFLL